MVTHFKYEEPELPLVEKLTPGNVVSKLRNEDLQFSLAPLISVLKGNLEALVSKRGRSQCYSEVQGIYS